MDGESSEELDVVFRANFLGETERLSRKSLEGQGALGINGEPGCIVMITAHGDGRDCVLPTGRLHEVLAHSPPDRQCTRVGRNSRSGRASSAAKLEWISETMTIFTKSPALRRTNTAEPASCESQFVARSFGVGDSPTKPRQGSSAELPLGPGRAAVQANPFALCILCSICTD